MTTILTFADQVNNFAVRVGSECKRISDLIGTLSSLNTSDKTSIVAAIKEIKTATTTLQGTLNSYSTELSGVKTQQSTNTGDISTLKGSMTTLQSNLKTLQDTVDSIEGVLESQSEIDDSKASTVSTYSSSKVEAVVSDAKTALKNELLGGAGSAADTLKELADLIAANGSSIATLQTLAAGHVKFDAAQTLSDTQKSTARSNIGAADSATVSGYGTRLTAVETKASTAETNIATLTSNVGNTSTDFVAAFEAALAG